MRDWTRIKNINRLNFSGRALRFCYIGVSYFVLENRNSYYAYSSVRYGESPFYLSLINAKKFIQKNRNKGSAWKIQQTPVIVLAFDKMQIAINFPNWDCLKLNFSVEKKPSLSGLIRYLSRHNSVYFYKDINKSVEPMISRPKNHNSYVSNGSIRWKVRESSSYIPAYYFDLLKVFSPLTKANIKNQLRAVARFK